MEISFEEKYCDGVLVRRSVKHPKLWASADGRVVGVRGHWLSPGKLSKRGELAVHYHDADKKNITVLVHRLVGELFIANPLGLPFIDHIDGNPANNVFENLRWATRRTNNQNRKAHRDGTASSRFVGVYWNKKGSRWLARITTDRTTTYLGTYKNEEDAAKAYDDALIVLGLGPINLQAAV